MRGLSSVVAQTLHLRNYYVDGVASKTRGSLFIVYG